MHNLFNTGISDINIKLFLRLGLRKVVKDLLSLVYHDLHSKCLCDLT